MSFGFGVGDIIAVSTLARTIWGRFRDASDQFHAIQTEVAGLCIILDDIKNNLSELRVTDKQAKELSELTKGCRGVLNDTENLIRKNESLGTESSGLGSRTQKALKKLRWDSAAVNQLRDRMVSNATYLNAFNTNIASQISQATNDNVKVITQDVRSLRLNQSQQEREAVLEWLSPLNFAPQQSELSGRRQEGTGSWLLESPEFQKWVSEDGKTLVCQGMPGAGKTMLASLVVDHLQQHPSEENVATAYIYCDYKRQEEQTPVSLTASVAKQLLQHQDVIPEAILKMYRHHGQKGTRPSFEEMLEITGSSMARLSRLFLIVDALDELGNAGQVRQALIGRLRPLQDSYQFNLMATSRYISSLALDFNQPLLMDVRASPEDIRRYVEGHISDLPNCVKKNIELQEDIATAIIDAVKGMFLLAQLHIDSLRDKTSTKLIKKALEALPKGSNALDGAYRGAMQRVDDQMEGFRILAKQLLGWLTYSERLMTVEEVQHALAIEPGTPDFDEENLGDIDEVVGFCAGLVIVDEETQIIRLVHYTTQEYFRRNGDRILASARQEIAISCLTYLLYDIFGTGWFHEAEEGNNSGGDEWEIGERYGWQSFESVKARAQKYPFLKYASRYWATHARICEQQNVKTLTMSLAKDERRISSASQVMLSVNQDALSYELDITKSRHPLTAMHVIAYLGYPEMIKELLSHGFEVNSKDLAHRTPLWYAAHQGHEAVVELLLSQSHIEVNSKDDPDDTALHVAAALGHEAIVKLLISRTDVEVNSKDQHGRTALHRAALGGHASIVKLLLGCFNIDVNSKDDYGSRPLHKAAKFGHAVVLKLLISHTDLDVNLEDIVGHTALHEAVRCGDASIVELLLGCFNIDVDSKDEYGSTLLHRAAGLGHAAVLKLLISHTNLDVNAENSLGSTALHNAARFGHASIVELLLGCFNIDVNLKDNYGSTPLHEAAKPFIFTVQQDNESLMTMLLGHIAIEVNPKNSLGATPLALAIVYGHVAAIQLLCARPDVDLDPRDDQGRDVYALVKENKSFLSRFEEMLESFGPEEEEKLAEESNGVFKGSPSHDRIQSKLVPKQEECLEILRTAIEARARDRLHRIQVAEGSVDMELIPPISDESL